MLDRHQQHAALGICYSGVTLALTHTALLLGFPTVLARGMGLAHEQDPPCQSKCSSLGEETAGGGASPLVAAVLHRDVHISIGAGVCWRCSSSSLPQERRGATLKPVCKLNWTPNAGTDGALMRSTHSRSSWSCGGVWREVSTAVQTTSARIENGVLPEQPATSSGFFSAFLAAITLLQGTTFLANPGVRLYRQTYCKFLQDWDAVIQRHEVGAPNPCLLLPFLTIETL